MLGYMSLNMRPGTWPVDHIWFNDRRNLETSLGIANPREGWMDKLIDSNDQDSIRTEYEDADIPFVNDDGLAFPSGGKLIVKPNSGKLSFTNIPLIHGPTEAGLIRAHGKL